MKESSTQLNSLLEQCRKNGLRRTRALESLLGEMIAQALPISLNKLNHAMGNVCDPATTYRLLIRLEEKGLVRRLGLHHRTSYFFLKIAGQHRDFLICENCGTIDTIARSCPVEELEKEIARDSGFTQLYHELEFFGLCPECSEKI